MFSRSLLLADHFFALVKLSVPFSHCICLNHALHCKAGACPSHAIWTVSCYQSAAVTLSSRSLRFPCSDSTSGQPPVFSMCRNIRITLFDSLNSKYILRRAVTLSAHEPKILPTPQTWGISLQERPISIGPSLYASSRSSLSARDLSVRPVSGAGPRGVLVRQFLWLLTTDPSQILLAAITAKYLRYTHYGTSRDRNCYDRPHKTAHRR